MLAECLNGHSTHHHQAVQISLHAFTLRGMSACSILNASLWGVGLVVRYVSCRLSAPHVSAYSMTSQV